MNMRSTPSAFIAFFNLITFVLVVGVSLATHTQIHFINSVGIPGADYGDFYQASLLILDHKDPYLHARFVTPPLFAILNVPLALLGFRIARAVFISAIPLSLFFSYRLIFQKFSTADAQSDNRYLLSGILIMLCSYPIYFLFERGNMDGVVLLCMCVGLAQLYKKPWLGGLFLAVATLLKLYPIILLAPLFSSRRWRPLLWTCAWIFVLIALTLPFWSGFAANSNERLDTFRFDENGSLINTVMIPIAFLHGAIQNAIGDSFVNYATISAALLYGCLIISMIWIDFKQPSSAGEEEQLINLLFYLPFMVALPRLVYHYEFVVLLPLIPALDFISRKALSRRAKYSIALVTLGMALSQWQAIALYSLTKNMLAHYIPGVGLLLIMTGISIYKWIHWQETRSAHQTRVVSVSS